MPEHLVDVNGTALCAEAFGDPEHPVVLLIHGTGSTMLSWPDELCARFAAAGRFVIRYDSRDAGRSTGSVGAPGYTLRDLAADAVGVLERFDAARGHLVGMSGGAAAAQLAALEHPSRVATLTLACATPGIPGVETGDLPPPTVRFPAASAVDWSDRDAVVAYLVEAERPYAAQFDEVSTRALMERVVDRAIDIRASAAKPFEVDAGAPWRQRLGDIAVPTLVVHGRQDPMFPPAHGRALAAEIPDAELLILDGMGHEHFPPATWDLVVPAILRHTA
ncbi:MAG TPA: alpha/beta fold hydrolase [Baekduia sp.]|nr:alpha/beta fold hydrolase [Baekduia sp.]